MIGPDYRVKWIICVIRSSLQVDNDSIFVCSKWINIEWEIDHQNNTIKVKCEWNKLSHTSKEMKLFNVFGRYLSVCFALWV